MNEQPGLRAPVADPRLRQSNDAFMALIQHAPTGVYLVDANFRLAQISEGCRKVFSGIDPLLGRDFADILRIVWPEPFASEAIERFRHTLVTGESYRSADTTEQRGNVAAEESYDWQISRLLLPDGTFGVVCYFHETTLQVQAQRTARHLAELADQLRQSEERYRALVNASSDVVYRMSADWTEMHHLEGRAFLPDTHETSRSWMDRYIHPDDRASVAAAAERAIATESVFELEHRVIRVDGTYGWTFSRAIPLRNHRGELTGWFGTATDVNERKRAETNEQLMRDRFNIVRDAADVGFWFCDLPFDTLIWDNRVKKHFWLPHDATVTIETFYAQLHPDDRERTRQAIERSIADHTQYDIEYRTVSAAGEEKWIRAIGRTFYDVHDRPIRFDGVTLDITDRKRAEDALRENDRRKDEFLAMLAHELRNPLAPIRHAAQVLKVTSPADANQRWARDVIERQTQHITRLVDDLLDVSRITRGKITLERERINTATLIERAVEESHPLIAARGHHLSVNLPATPVYVEGDLTRLVQVVANLVNNAVKFTERGGTIVVSAAAEDGRATIRVRDNGVGIPADLLRDVFDLFTQADRSLDRSQGGLGIGLTLVRLLVEGHGGTVEAISDGPGRGSEFVVRLPLAEPPQEAAPHDEAPEQAADGRGDMRVLIVEDSIDSAEMLSYMLQLSGYLTRYVHDGRAALDFVGEFKPHVILCDIGLPGMSGYELAEQLRAHGTVAAACLIALSGYGQEEDRRRSKLAGFDHHLVKPVEPSALFELLESIRQER